MIFLSDSKVELIDHMGNDRMIANAAWISTDADYMSKSDEQVAGLINFLMRDRHHSPFEHNSMTFRVHTPIFVVREIVRHRVGMSYNEESGRYTQLKPVFYVPDDDRPLVQVGKPGAYEFVEGSPEMVNTTYHTIRKSSRDAFENYQLLLNDGVAREVARMILPVNIYSSLYITCNARSLMHFLSLRTKHPDAAVPSYPQYEIQQVADKMEALFAEHFPVTHAAFNQFGRA